MNCERAVELMIDALVEPLDASHSEALREHLAGCEACAAEAAAYRRMWRSLENVAVPARSGDGRRRLDAAVRDEFGVGITTSIDAAPVTRPSRPLLSAAAALLLVAVGVLLGVSIAEFTGRESGPAAGADDRNRYLLIMTGTQEPPEQAADRRDAFRAWIDDLEARGILESGIGLADGPPVGTPPDGPLMAEDVAGFIIIRAIDEQHARRIVVSSPVIDYGGFIDIRALDGAGND